MKISALLGLSFQGKEIDNNRCNKEINCVCDELINDMGGNKQVDEDRGNLRIGTGNGATLANMVLRAGVIEKVPFEKRR